MWRTWRAGMIRSMGRALWGNKMGWNGSRCRVYAKLDGLKWPTLLHFLARGLHSVLHCMAGLGRQIDECMK